MTVERDVVERLERAGVGYYVTWSEALAVWAEPRQTLDIDIVTDLAPDRYESIIRPAFEDAELARFLLRRLYPDLDGERLDAIMAQVETEWRAGTWTGFSRPATLGSFVAASSDVERSR